jgi:hypothetical protein
MSKSKDSQKRVTKTPKAATKQSVPATKKQSHVKK